MTIELNGRKIDTSCPFSDQCFADMGCWRNCPETLYDVLKRSAQMEHELGLLPHTDPDLQAVCPVRVCRHARLPNPPGGNGGGSP